MDEPTNYLNDFPGAFIVVSHDYDFLGRITNCIIDIDFGTITRYTGTLKQAMRQKEANRQTYLKAYANQQRQIAKTEAYIRKNKAGTRAWFPWCQGAPAYMAVRSLLDGNLPQAQQEVQRVAIVTASIALGVLLSTMFQEAMVKHLRRIHVREKKE